MQEAFSSGTNKDKWSYMGDMDVWLLVSSALAANFVSSATAS